MRLQDLASARCLALSVLGAQLLSACTALGRTEVRVESGNQTAGYLSRPLSLTASSDESVQQVAQGICDNVRPGSSAHIVFVGKVPGPGPVDLAAWGRYRYDCELASAAAKLLPGQSTPPPSTFTVAGAGAAAPAAAKIPLAIADQTDKHRRECLLQRGSYHICLGNCILNSTSAVESVVAECQQRCITGTSADCN